MKKVTDAALVFYLLTWTIAGLYFGNAGVINNQYYTEIRNIPKEDFKRIPVEAEPKMKTDSTQIKYKVYLDKYGNKYSSKGALLTAEIQSKVQFEWLFEQSEGLILILASCFLGALGAIIRLIKDMIVDKAEVDTPRILVLPVAGFFNGFLILSIAYAIPKYLTSEKDVNLNPASVMVLSLIAGIYVEIFMAWLNSLASSLFKIK